MIGALNKKGPQCGPFLLVWHLAMSGANPAIVVRAGNLGVSTGVVESGRATDRNMYHDFFLLDWADNDTTVLLATLSAFVVLGGAFFAIGSNSGSLGR